MNTPVVRKYKKLLSEIEELWNDNQDKLNEIEDEIEDLYEISRPFWESMSEEERDSFIYS